MSRSRVESQTVWSSYHHPLNANDHASAASCIAGMHRSGTSMVARLLHECGVYLGPEDELSRPGRDNLEGYFENPRFVTLNEEIMNQFGGSWNEPPKFPPGWEFEPEISPLLERAEDLFGEFRRPQWGWKDPRNSLTLPFWQRVVPDLKVIVCVRNPLEVARSLFVRGDTISPAELDLWMTYYRQLLSTTTPANRLITHYQSYFQNAPAELRRVLDWLDLEASDETVERACEHISPELRHHSVSTAELIGAGVADEVLGLYLSLCGEAGPVCQQARKHEIEIHSEPAAARANEVSVLMNELQELRAYRATKEHLLDEILNSRSFKLVSFCWRLRRSR